jgi:formylglycine-generating enzyme required for sulfatase activity
MLRVLWIAIFAGMTCLTAVAQDTAYPPRYQQIPAPECMNLHYLWDGPLPPPCPANIHERWLSDLQHWRTERRIRSAFDASRYDQPALRWTQSSFMQPQLMVHDRFFFDPATGRYTVDRYLDDLEKRYGGIDAALVWATYPNMGVDDRNQMQMVESMPGGVEGVRQMVADFHRRGVKVLFPMMMWDQGTQLPATNWPDALASLMKSIDADGINGDTQDGVPLGFSLAAEKIGHPLAFQPEGGPSDEALAWNVMTWGQYNFPFVPMVDRYKWLETRHMVNISDRWATDKTDDLQFAFFNGVGWESWENVWGYWIGINPRDAEATRRVAALERAVAPVLVSPDWEPLYPMDRFGVYASRWPNSIETVWTIVNRNDYSVDGPQMEASDWPGTRYFDLYHGVELKPEFKPQADTVAPSPNARGVEPKPQSAGRSFSISVQDYGPAKKTAVLSFPIEAHGFAAILATPTEPGDKLKALLKRMAEMTAKPLSSYQHWSPVLQQTITSIAPTEPAAEAPTGMVRIPGGSFHFVVRGIEIEGGDKIGIDVQYPWEDSPRRFHDHVMQLQPFYIDRYPVTNAEFKAFLDASHYAPRDQVNFLRDWKNGTYPEGWENRPVTWVSLEDARAYAQWAGKRLPHEWEWQMAAQGTDGRLYPWGRDWLVANVPAPDQGHTMRGPDPVDAHPQGGSPYGVMDMVGNVWQWTDEFSDEHTRAAIVRGGEYYQPQGSVWYFPQSYRNDEHGKLLLMSPGYDRSGGIGFRCVRDAKD